MSKIIDDALSLQEQRRRVGKIARDIARPCEKCDDRHEFHNHQVQPSTCALCTGRVPPGPCADRSAVV